MLTVFIVMYAMCNLHDVTWGTKGDNGSSKDLGGAKKVKGEDGKEMLEVELPTAREDVDQIWQASRTALSFKPAEEKEHRDAATKQADHDRNSRTNVVQISYEGGKQGTTSLSMRMRSL